MVSLLPVVDQLVKYHTHAYSCRAAVHLGVTADGRKALDEEYVVASMEYAPFYQVDVGHEELVYVVTLTA